MPVSPKAPRPAGRARAASPGSSAAEPAHSSAADGDHTDAIVLIVDAWADVERARELLAEDRLRHEAEH